MRYLIILLLLFSSGCTTINITTSGDVIVDAHKEITVSEPSATVGIPLL